MADNNVKTTFQEVKRGPEPKQHSEGRGATYTRTRLPVTLLYQQEGLTRSKALIQEAQVKAMPRAKKEEIILSEHKVLTGA